MSGFYQKKWVLNVHFTSSHKLINIKPVKIALLVLNFIWFIIQAEAQEFPPIIRYSTADYNAGNQNWKISQDNNGFMYFANNDGLMEYNGADWHLYASPNETIIRAVKVVGEKIYTGCYMEFGYWLRQNDGSLRYFSLSSKIKDKLQQDEHFWEIINIDEWVLFQSLHRIYVYNTITRKINIIAPENGMWRIFSSNNEIYFQILNEGLFRLVHGKPALINNNKILKQNQICNVFTKGSDIFIQTEKAGLYILTGSQIRRYKGTNSSIFNQNEVFSSIVLNNGSIVLGTISNGIFILSEEFELSYHITQENGLSNNTALSLFEDKDKNLWIGLDNGINCLNMNSSYRCFFDKTGILGTVYTSILFKGILYLGTNQGLFAKKYNSLEEFRLIDGTKGQVWSLFEYAGVLFCGHNKGTFIVEEMKVRNIYSESGTWKFNPVPNKKDIILQGNYNGLSKLKYKNGNWTYSGKIRNFNISSRFFEIDNDNYIYISHEYKGIFRALSDEYFDYIKEVKLLDFPSKTKNAGLITFSNEIIYFSKNGYFILDTISKLFTKNDFYQTQFDKSTYISGKMTVDEHKRLWQFSSQGIDYFYFDNISPSLKKSRICLNTDLIKSNSGYENIQNIEDQKYLIGTTDGYIIFDLSDVWYKKGKLFINKLVVTNIEGSTKNYSLNEEVSLDHKSNSLSISFSMPVYNKYNQATYKYNLEGYSKEWSEWSPSSTAVFKKLPPGKYTLKIKGKTGDDSSISEINKTILIRKPFYATPIAIFIYLLILIFTGFIINKIYSLYYTRQKNKLIAEHNLKMEFQHLENEQKLMKLKNMELIQDVDQKSKELAVSTLDLIRKNEIIKIIKDDLKKHKDTPDFEKFLSLLSDFNVNISKRDSWIKFSESFDSIDKDFIKRLHVTHNDLTSSELKLCVYLRINMSSKEIAPILGISVKSVEIKRYRIRKKLGLEHNESLNNYLFNL